MGFCKTLLLTSILLSSSFIVYRVLEKAEDTSLIEKLPYKLTGNKESNVMLIFLHGYPNTIDMWKELVDKLEPNFLCLCITYPNFSNELVLRWGMALPQLTKLIKKTIDHVEKESNKKFKHALVTHDWGAILGYMVEKENPEYFSDMIAFDVTPFREADLKSTVKIMSYQLYLTSAFFIGGPVGDFMTQQFIHKYLQKKVYGLPEDQFDKIDHSWNYMYYYLWTNILTFKNMFNNYLPKCPFVFIYGKDKPYMFHTKDFLDKISKKKNSEAIGLPGGHWIMKGNIEMIVELINKRL